jgi:hypothetical protein
MRRRPRVGLPPTGRVLFRFRTPQTRASARLPPSGPRLRGCDDGYFPSFRTAPRLQTAVSRSRAARQVRSAKEEVNCVHRRQPGEHVLSNDPDLKPPLGSVGPRFVFSGPVHRLRGRRGECDAPGAADLPGTSDGPHAMADGDAGAGVVDRGGPAGRRRPIVYRPAHLRTA